jgi:hypothetical protein
VEIERGEAGPVGQGPLECVHDAACGCSLIMHGHHNLFAASYVMRYRLGIHV